MHPYRLELEKCRAALSERGYLAVDRTLLRINVWCNSFLKQPLKSWQYLLSGHLFTLQDKNTIDTIKK